MDSEDSRDGSSGSDSEEKSPGNIRSSSRESVQRSIGSRSKSPHSGASSPDSRSSQSRPQSPDSDSQSPHSSPNGPRSPPNDRHSPQGRLQTSPKASPRGRRSPQTPHSTHSSRHSHSSERSSSSSSDEERHSPYNRSERSRSRSRPHTPKSPDSYHSEVAHSPDGSRGRPKTPQSATSTPKRKQSPTNSEGPRSPSPADSSRSSSPASPPRTAVKSPASGDDERCSVRSNSSSSTKKSHSRSPDRISRTSGRSNSSRGSIRNKSRRKSDDGSTSDSSASSVDSSSRKNKNITKVADTQPEEISDGDMESDKDGTDKKEVNGQRAEINISHEDLSDVSDLEESIGGHSDENVESSNVVKENGDNHKSFEETKTITDKTSRADDGEEQLDFEAEDGECGEVEAAKEETEKEKPTGQEDGGTVQVKKADKEPEELEEGEVTDEEDVRPEETEPRPVCRFFSRGQCTWGASCRFLHPGVTDKGNYTMFELIRPVVPGEFGRDERMYGKPDPPQIESAWERGLRTAKEMLRKSIKRKEQDIDFEEKKMNLTLAQEEFDKENGYYGRVASPEPRYVRHVTEYPVARPPPEDYYGRRPIVYEPEYVPQQRDRVRSYRELPSHRMPDFYNNKYEEEPASAAAKPRKPKREVIVQRAEERQGRGDEWSDPWMRSKSPAGRRKESGRKRSYSSGSSYTSSSSTRSSSESSRSSYRSRSRSSHRRRRRSRSRRSRVSPSVIVSERKAANERAALMNPPAPRKRAPSPGMMRVSGAANPPAPAKEDQFGRTRSKLVAAALAARVKSHRRSSRSSSDSSGSSSSDSDSSASSSSSSRDGSSPPRRATGMDMSIAKAMDVLKGSTTEKRQIKLNLKTPVVVRKPEVSDISRKAEAIQGKKRQASSPPAGDPKSKKATSRREELLKQLKAVEDAIAKKRSKVN